jgi:hypothetical protein
MKTKSLHIVIVMIMFLMQIPTAFSQDFSVGGKVGIDLSSFSHWSKFKSDDLKDASNIKHPPKIGLQIGAVGNYTFNEYLALQVELLVQQKGESYKFQEQYLNDTYSNKKSQTVTYITIPILARGNYSFGKFTISAVLGPYIGTEKQKFGKTKNDSSELKLHRFDIGLSFGIIPSYELGPGSIFLDLRYDLGFIDAYNPNTKPEDYLTACNRNFGISVGYLVKLGK